MITNISFKEIMYGYAAEDAFNAKELKVFIPEIFIDKNDNTYTYSTRKSRGSNNIFINTHKPAVSAYSKVSNYITLPVASFNNVNVTKGDKLILSFVNNNPLNGAVIGKVDK